MAGSTSTAASSTRFPDRWAVSSGVGRASLPALWGSSRAGRDARPTRSAATTGQVSPRPAEGRRGSIPAVGATSILRQSEVDRDGVDAPCPIDRDPVPPDARRSPRAAAGEVPMMGETTLPDDRTLPDGSTPTTPEATRRPPGRRRPASDSHPATIAGDVPPAATGRGVPVIPGYQIEGELGRGGMGVVYKARQVTLNRTVALKMILAGDHASDEAGVRFLAEAEAAAKLQHPGVVQIFHIAEHDGASLHRDGVRRRREPRRSARRRPAPAPRGRAADRGPRPRHRRGAPAGDRPPRPEAGQHPDDARGGDEDRRLRPGEAPGRRLGADGDRVDPRLAELHGPRAGRGEDEVGRPAGRPLRAGGDPLRAPDRPPPVPGRDGAGDAPAGEVGRAGRRPRGWCRGCRGTSRRSR